MKLYELSAELRDVQEWIDANPEALAESGGVLPDDIAAKLDAAGAFDAKVEHIALLVREIKGAAKQVSDESERLYERSRGLMNNATWWERYLQRCLEVAGTAKVAGKLATVWLQRSPPSVALSADLDLDDAAIRQALDGFVVTETSHRLDKKALIEAHKAGAPLPVGVSVTQGTSLRIR